MRKLTLVKKILLCLLIFLMGYIVVITYNYRSNAASEAQLFMVSTELYPATAEALQLKEQFSLQMKMYEESIVYGNEILFDSARLKKDLIMSHIDNIKYHLGSKCEKFINMPELCDLDTMKTSYKSFIERAEKQYRIILEDINNADQEEAKKLIEQSKNFDSKFNGLYIKLNETCKDDLEIIVNNFKAERKVSIIVLAVVLLVSFIIVTFLIRKSIIKPISQSVDKILKMSKGDLSIRFDEKGEDEIGRIGRALNLMADFLEKRVELALAIADGNLDVNVLKASENDTLGEALNTMVTSLNEIVCQLGFYSDNVASGTMQIVDSNQYVSKGASNQAAALDEITSSMTQIEGQTTENANKAEKAFEYANETLEASRTGVSIMDELTGAMNEINNDSKLITKIINTINELAFQTNLLALNASVEAARAGKHGKGFAVVAQEVRNLAARSAKAAQDTEKLIENSKKNVKNGNHITEKTVEILSEIESRVTEVVDFISGIATASKEQSQSISLINNGLLKIESVTQQNTAITEEAYVSCQELSAMAVQVRNMLKKFKVAEGIEYDR